MVFGFFVEGGNFPVTAFFSRLDAYGRDVYFCQVPAFV
jgi:hypothetical protein